MAKRSKLNFQTEADLCSAFIESLPPEWQPYAETAGWDILLVRKADGFQIGIQAKLRFNVDVLGQCLDDSVYQCTHEGPDCVAVLVPYDLGGGLSRIAAYIGITVLRVTSRVEKRDGTYYNVEQFTPQLPKQGKPGWREDRDWFEQAPPHRCKLPEYVPDVVAGSSAPLQLTDWKIKALKLMVLLEKNGHVDRADFKHLDLDHRRWLARENGWLKVVDGRMVKGGRCPNFKAQHPKVYREIKRDFDRWRSPKQKPKTDQPTLGI